MYFQSNTQILIHFFQQASELEAIITFGWTWAVGGVAETDFKPDCWLAIKNKSKKINDRDFKY